MKYSVTSYSFSQLINSGAQTQLSVISLAAALGFEGIEFTDLCPPAGETALDYAVRLRQEADRVGLPIVCYAVGANLLAEDWPAELARLKGQVDVAAALGAPVMRHDAYFAFPAGDADPTFEKYFDQVVARFREVTCYAAEKGVKTCTENHGLICQDSARIKAIVEAVAHPNFGWLVDVGNFQCVDEDSLAATKTGAPYAFHAHAKDFVLVERDNITTRGGRHLRGTVVGQGIVPTKACLDALRAAGYDGFVTVEFEGPEPCLAALHDGLRFLREE